MARTPTRRDKEITVTVEVSIPTILRKYTEAPRLCRPREPP